MSSDRLVMFVNVLVNLCLYGFSVFGASSMIVLIVVGFGLEKVEQQPVHRLKPNPIERHIIEV